MKELEKLYIQALVQHSKPNGDVLEIGFFKPSVLEIRKFHPKSHTVIEADPQTAKKAKSLSDLTLIENDWETAGNLLKDYDTIIINGYPFASSANSKLAITDLQFARGLLEEEKKIVKMVEETLPNLSTIKYTDADLDVFLAEIGNGQAEDIVRFLQSLTQNGQISPIQYQDCLERHQLVKGKAAISSFWKNPDSFLEFLSLYTQRMLRKGGRLFCYIDKNSSKYDDPEFFNQIITNPALKYEEKLIAVNSSEAIIMMIQRI